MTEKGMTNIKKIALVSSAFLASLMLCVLVMAAQPAKAYAASVNQISATANSITVSWEDPSANTPSYTTTGYKVLWGKSNSEIIGTVDNGLKTSYTISGLQPGNKYYIKIECNRKNASTGTPISTPYTYSSFNCATRVVKPTGVKQVKWYYYNKNVEFSWNKQDAATSVEWKVCKASNGKKVEGGTVSAYRTSDTASKISNNVVYTAQVRVKDAYGWSPWSDKAYLFTQPMLLDSKTKATNGKLNIAWGKINGATGYTVYLSTKEKSGYKKLATLKSTKTKYVVKKFKGKKISKSKTYYVYVVANKKVGKKTYTSGKLYTCKIKGSVNSLRWTF